MAKIHLKSLIAPETLFDWRGFVETFEPTEIDQIMAKYDSEEKFGGRFMTTDGSAPVSAKPPLATRPEPQVMRVATQIPRFARAEDPNQRRAAARASFNRQVQEARNHAADILSKIGNGR